MNDQVSEADAAGWRDSFRWRWRYSFLVAFIALALLFYAAIPTLIHHVASAVGGRLGLSELEVETGYFRLGSLNVPRLDMIGDGFRLQARRGRLTYDPADLLRGRLESVSFEILELTLLESQAAEAAGIEYPVKAGPAALEQWSSLSTLR